MGVTWSSVSECLGDFSHSHSRNSRLPPSRRLTQTSSSRSSDRQPALRYRYTPDDKLTVASPSPQTSTAQQHQPQQHQQHQQQQQPQPQPHQQCLKKHCVSRLDPTSIAPSSHGAAIAPPPPPLVPAANAVYDLLDDEDEEACPTCLEPYSPDNPKIGTTCGHDFHLQCIVAWETRSGTRFCPICASQFEYVEADSKQLK